MNFHKEEVNSDMAAKPLAVRVPEAARLLDVSRSKMYGLLQAGELPSMRVGKSIRIPVAALQAWVEERTTGKGGKADGAPHAG